MTTITSKSTSTAEIRNVRATVFPDGSAAPDVSIAAIADGVSIPVTATVDTAGAANIATGQVSVSPSSPTLIMAARATRRRAIITNASPTSAIYIGGPLVAHGDGLFLSSDTALILELHTTAAIYAVSASGTVQVSYLEEYDS